MKMALRCAATLLCCAAAAQQTHAPLELMGVRLGQSTEQVRRTLSGHATFEKEEERQQVWRVLHDPDMQYLIVGFDRENHVRYITALAASDGPALPCAPLGDVSTAVKTGDAGSIEMRRDLKDSGNDLTVIARGTSPDHISSCSIKKQGAGTEQEEEE